MVVDKRTVLNDNREGVHVRWAAKRGNEIDLIGQLNVTGSSVIPGGQQVVLNINFVRDGRLYCSIHMVY